MKFVKIAILNILAFSLTIGSAQKIVRYELSIKDSLVNFSGKEKRGIAVNGQIPMPTLTSIGIRWTAMSLCWSWK